MFKRRVSDRLGTVSRVGAGRGADTHSALPRSSVGLDTGRSATPGCRILIVSASMGAGHDGAARELARRLTDSGHDVEVRDFLEAAPIGLGRAAKSGYEFELKHLAWLYDLTYWACYRLRVVYPVIVWVASALTGRRLRSWLRQTDADVVVSTYPLATLALGWLRRHGRIPIPVVNFITDFGVHPLWLHRGADLNLAVHSQPAQVAARRYGRPTLACGPVVSDRFGRLPDREQARRQLGLSAGEHAVLVVAGSWGVGGLEETVEALARARSFVPVVVCGRDLQLADDLERVVARRGGRAIILGWTDQMPALMSAADALVENAGGLTSLEALRAGLPVVSFRPIAGHGRENTKAMARAGVSRLAHSATDLVRTLESLCQPTAERAAQILAGRSVFREDATPYILQAAALPLRTPARPPRRRPAGVVVRVAAACSASLGLIWVGSTIGVGAAAAAGGVGTLRPSAQAGPVAYIGVRLNAAELASPAIRRDLTELDATAVIEAATARADPRAVEALADQQVNVANGGNGPQGRHHRRHFAVEVETPWSQAFRNVKAGSTLGHLVGQPVTLFVPRGSLTAFELVDCYERHNHVVLPNSVLSPTTTRLRSLAARRIYVVNGLATSPAQLDAFLHRLGARLGRQGLLPAPLGALA